MEAVAVSGLSPPRMLLFLSIEHRGVAISLLGFTRICPMATLIPSRSGVSAQSCSGAGCFLRHIVSPFNTCKASRHPLCFHSVLAFLGSLVRVHGHLIGPLGSFPPGTSYYRSQHLIFHQGSVRPRSGW